MTEQLNAELTAEIKRIFELQRRNGVALKASSVAERKEKLVRLREAIVADAVAIGEAQYKDMRKMALGVNTIEVAATLQDIDDAIVGIEQWMQPEIIEPSPEYAGNKTYIMYEPRGVCLLFGPWNFPFHLVMSPLVPILAAGNSAIVKPNELAPATSAIVAKILRQVFDESEVAVVEGGVTLANALLELPVDHIFFTGSPNVGKTIMAAAAGHLATVTLELGGKCPVVLDEGVDLADIAAKVSRARFFNAGQLCLASDHVWLHESQREEFVGHLQAAVRQMFYKDGQLNKVMMSRIVDARNFARVKGYIEDACERGAKVAFGGVLDADDLTIEPTALVDVPLDARIMQDEIFGPVLPVLTYRDLDEVIAKINDGGKPLALYVFSEKQDFIDRLLLNTSSGGVTVNGILSHAGERRLPFGGVNGSGIGRYKGIYGFRELSNSRSVFVHQQAT